MNVPDPLREALAGMIWGLRAGTFTDPLVIAERLESATATPPERAETPQASPAPSFLFDGFAVLQALSEKAKGRTSAENVADTLDAVVRLMRAHAKGAPQPSPSNRRTGQ